VLLVGFQFYRVFGWAGGAFGAALALLLFGCVTIHELAHSLVAKRFGIGVKEIVLLPIGGVARLMREPDKPHHELLIALAGPLANLVIALALALVAHLTYGLPLALFEAPAAMPSLAGLLGWLFWANVMLCLFNLVPALPMDGGRVFRAVLSMFCGRLRATKLAASVGQMIAVAFTAYGLVSLQPILALIGVFVFFAAAHERTAVRAEELLVGLNAGHICDSGAVALAPNELVSSAIGAMLRSPQHHFPVMQGSELVGVVSRDDALAAATVAGLEAYVAGVMRRDVRVVEATMAVEELRAELMRSGGGPLSVCGPSGYLGLVGLEDLARAVAVAEALDRRGLLNWVAPTPRDASLLR
jgi:Zn-dependent protease